MKKLLTWLTGKNVTTPIIRPSKVTPMSYPTIAPSISPTISPSVSPSISPSISPSASYWSNPNSWSSTYIGFCTKCRCPVIRNIHTEIPCRVDCISCGYDNQVIPFEAFDCAACSKRVDCMILNRCEVRSK